MPLTPCGRKRLQVKDEAIYWLRMVVSLRGILLPLSPVTDAMTVA